MKDVIGEGVLHRNIYMLFFLTFFIILSFGVFYSPHIAFWSCMILLVSRMSNSSIFRNTIVFVAVLMILFTAASRTIGMALNDDLIDTYMPIVNSQILYHSVFSAGLGIEIAYPFYINILLSFFQLNDPRFVLFLTTILTLFFYLLWLYFFLLPSIERKDRGIAVALSLSFIQLGLLTQVLRQEMATPILLMAIFSWGRGNKIGSLAFLILATSIHSSSLIIFFFFVLFPLLRVKGKIFVLLMFLLFSVCVFLYPSLVVSFFSIIQLSFIGNKIIYYEGAQFLGGFEAFWAGKFYLLIVLFIIFCRSFLKRVSFNDPFYKSMYDFCFLGCLCNLTLILLPNAGRFFLVIPGFLMVFVLYPIMKRYPVMFRYLFFVFIMCSFFFPQRLVGGGNPGFELWQSYSWIGEEPFYYLSWLF